MKNKTILSLIVIVIIVMLFSSCSINRENSVYMTNASKVCVNYQSPATMSFNLVVLSKKEIQNIKCIGVEGTNIEFEKFNVDVFDNSVEELKNYTKKGWRVNNYMVEISYKDNVENCAFEKIIFDIDGTIEKISFDTTPQHKLADGNVFSDVLQINIFPNELPSSFINNNEQSATYEFTAKEDLSITGIRFKDFLNYDNVLYSIANENYQTASFPISVKKGETIKMSVSFSSATANNLCYVVTNMYFDYITAAEESANFCGAVIVFDPIYPLNGEDMTKIDRIIADITS